ncbi:MAG: nuclear transport factor 2 family protein, partial [Betaproteobacteria bacterium]|nr:nuclear transport factor 2 family protein [Betaproteobacteria bacterium]
MRAVKKASFPTPEDAEAAFYEAIERGDIDALMEVWSDDDEILCVHPGGERLTGVEQVRESWAQILRSGRALKVHLADQVVVQGMMLSIHSLHENILVQGESRARAPVVVTNVYQRGTTGWRMVVHHASPAPQPA